MSRRRLGPPEELSRPLRTPALPRGDLLLPTFDLRPRSEGPTAPIEGPVAPSVGLLPPLEGLRRPL